MSKAGQLCWAGSELQGSAFRSESSTFHRSPWHWLRGEMQNERVWWFSVMHKTTKRESWVTLQGERHKKKWCVLVWAEKNRHNLLSTIPECSNLISYLLLSQKISDQKPPNYYNLCVNKHIKYPGSAKSRSPWKKASSFLSCFSRTRQKHSFCPDQWLNILEKYIWFDTLNSLWGTCC